MGLWCGLYLGPICSDAKFGGESTSSNSNPTTYVSSWGPRHGPTSLLWSTSTGHDAFAGIVSPAIMSYSFFCSIFMIYSLTNYFSRLLYTCLYIYNSSTLYIIVEQVGSILCNTYLLVFYMHHESLTCIVFERVLTCFFLCIHKKLILQWQFCCIFMI